MIQFDDFLKIDIYVGTVLSAEDFPKARKPAYKLRIDFGETIGVKKSSAQITDYYTKEALVGKQIMAVTNFPPRQIADFWSEVLVLGAVEADGKVVLLSLTQPAENGVRIG